METVYVHTWKKSLKSAHTWKKSPYMEKAPMGAFSTFLINYLWPQKVVGRSIGRFLNKLRYITVRIPPNSLISPG